MSEMLTFMMGEFEAEFPTDRLYAKNHMWARPMDDRIIQFGFTAYAVRLLQDVYFLDWLIDAPATLSSGQEFGSVESKKAESALYAPIAGQLIRFNENLMDDPSTINVDKYERGWLFEMSGSSDDLINPEDYLALLVDVWDKTQRTIKGQLNE